MSNPIQLAINGAAGRMGQRLVALATADPELRVSCAIETVDSPHLGRDAGELAGIGPIAVPIAAELSERVDVVIDFSTPEGAVRIARMCADRRIPLIEATTGLNAEQRQEVLSAAQETVLVISPSMSLAVNLAMKLIEEAARSLRSLPSGVDVEIVERHHRFKEDAPSGTALRFGEIVAREMGQTDHRHGRQGQVGARPRTEIGYHALRTGDNVGEHQIIFGMLGETLEVSVRSHTRDSYAHGALAAAKFAITKSAGLYSMADVLRISHGQK